MGTALGVFFSFMRDADRGSVIQNGVLMAARHEALDRVRGNPRGIDRHHGRRRALGAPFAQTVVFVRDAGGGKALHAHQSSPR
jgi:hypothetical protein